MRIGTLVLVSLALLAWALPGDRAGDPSQALEEGNRLFARDQVEAALEAYTAGWSAAGPELAGLRGTLAYNAGTSALRLGRRPEALLWLRRAELAAPEDPWVRDNLRLARQSLGSPADGESGGGKAWIAWVTWTADGRLLQASAVVLAWVALVLLVLARRRGRGLVILVALLSCLAFVAGQVLDRRGRAAVLLASCPGGPPPGSEVWVRPTADGGWRIAGRLLGKGPRCPAGAVGLVAP